MTPTERERIIKEAEISAKNNNLYVDKQFYGKYELGYIAGATSEHDKARNQAIQDCIDIVSVTPGDENVIPKLESLKTIS